MINQADLEKLKKEVKEFFKKMGFDLEIEFSPQRDNLLVINLKSPEPQILIGHRGETLLEIQRLLKTILKRKISISEPFFIDLDINDYKKRRINYLKEMAKEAAEGVALTKKTKILPPMLAYERKIVHLELAERKDVTSESIGQEPERRVVIKPYP